MANNKAEYQVIVNWDKPSVISIDDFEASINGWVPTAGTTAEQRTDLFAHSGAGAMYLAPTVANQDPQERATKVLTGLVPGTVYVVNAWVRPYNNSYHLILSADNALYETYSQEQQEWNLLETSFEAVATTHTIRLSDLQGPQPNTIFLGVLVDDITRTTAGDDITCKVFGANDISFREGRDQARSLSAIAPAATDFEFINEDRMYSPNNPDSILYNRPGSGAALQIRALFEGRFYTLYNGFVDDFVVNQTLPEFSYIRISSFDQLGRMGAVNISTALYRSIRTGEAINVVLDEIGWPAEKRIIDYGATVIEWWWEEDTPALEAVTQLVFSEGIPAFIFIDELGNFVFRDRHHRYLLDDSVNRTAEFVQCVPEI